MKHFLVSYEVDEASPTYEFILKIDTIEKAKEKAKRIIKNDYPEAYQYKKDFECFEVTPEKLLEYMTLY
jgi:hypothetical protein